MKILVCISNVPDTTTKVKFIDENKKLDTSGIQWVINPWDELSLTRALELKDNASAGITSVTVAHVGPASSEPTIRKALAIGADDAIRINTEPFDAFYVAYQLTEAIKTGGYDIILCGIESSDYNGSNVGGMLAGQVRHAGLIAYAPSAMTGGTYFGRLLACRDVAGKRRSSGDLPRRRSSRCTRCSGTATTGRSSRRTPIL